jgi:hypothetical protein
VWCYNILNRGNRAKGASSSMRTRICNKCPAIGQQFVAWIERSESRSTF